ncbi:MAG: hypothetical protein JO108_29715 [Acidobacteriaceae bacterium]|nr:hypothetical protein [Acidobacteriaceae bacterium]
MSALSKCAAVALAIALLFGSGACLMACAGLPCGQISFAASPDSIPPCHRHHQNLPAGGHSEPCTHLSPLTVGETLTPVQIAQPDVFTVGLPASLNHIQSFRLGWTPGVQISSPPGGSPGSLTVLRI